MAINNYDYGEPVLLTFVTKTPAAYGSGLAPTAVNPATVVLRWTDPLANETVWTLAGGQITNPSTGVFQATIPTKLVVGTPNKGGAGRYRYHWEASTPDGAFDGEFFVRDSPLKT